jgi:DNA-binding NarL/FixJ family response regulator
MAEGHHDEAIANRAGISTTSVRCHIKAIMDKLCVNSRFAARHDSRQRRTAGQPTPPPPNPPPLGA